MTRYFDIIIGIENDAKNIKCFFLLFKWLPDIKQWIDDTSFDQKKKKKNQTLFKYALPQKEEY